MGKKKVSRFVYPEMGTQIEKLREALAFLGHRGSPDYLEFIVNKMQEEHGTYYDFLEALLRHEFAFSESWRIEQRINQGKLLPLTTIEDFEFEKQPSIDPVLINELASCRFIEEGRNVIFLGPPGVGKTHLATAIAYEAIKKGYDTRCMRLNEFIFAAQRATEARSEISTKRLHQSLIRPDLLILDDIDYYTTDEKTAQSLFDVLKERCEKKQSVIITSNRNPTEWGNLFGTKTRTKASLDRIFDKRYRKVIRIEGQSYRVPEPLSEMVSENGPN